MQLKALQCLSLLFKEKPKMEVVAILQQWAFEYKRLVMDYSREVRRATHEAMASLVVAVGRELAPNLKSLLGPWWFSQFDSYSEVSLAAKQSFQCAFPVQEKRLEALMLCTSDIFSYLEGNLKLITMPDKSSASDEMGEILQQVISSTMLALASLLEVLTSTQFATSEPKNASKSRAIAMSSAESLFASNKYFTTFLKSPSPVIRSASYSLLKRFLVSIPHAFDDSCMKVVAPEILGAFREKDTSCHPSMWDTMLLFSKKFPVSWRSVNAHKTVFNRLWYFLRNGCFGSQKISYPSLVVYLDTLPPTVVDEEQFFPEFFQSLWEGRRLSYRSADDYKLFFDAVKECFSWIMKTTSRFCGGKDSAIKFRTNLTNTVLIHLLWKEYLSLCEDALSHELGNCISEILCGIYITDRDLLPSFSASFQTAFDGVLQKSENSDLKVDPLIKFLMILGRNVKRNEENWQFSYLVGPMLAKCLPLIRSLESSDGLRILIVAISTFGSRMIVKKDETCLDGEDEQDSSYFLKVLKEVYIPWCLRADETCADTRLDLLLELLDDDECIAFPEQFHAITSFVIGSSTSEIDIQSLDSGKLHLLAMLLEKARKLKNCNPEHWQDDILDSLVVAVTKSPSIFINISADLVCAALGNHQSSFLSTKAINAIYEQIMVTLSESLSESKYSSFRNSVIVLGAKEESEIRTTGNPQFALDALSRSFSTFISTKLESDIVTSISTMVFMISWEAYLLTARQDSHNHTLQNYLYSIDDRLWKNMDNTLRMRVGGTLVRVIRSLLFDEETSRVVNLASLCCSWILDVFDRLCDNPEDDQNLLEQLFCQDQQWPVWAVSDFSKSGLVSSSLPFVSFLDKLFHKIGMQRIFFGEENTNRVWLAAEILCTWKWPEGSALESFLPRLSDCSKTEDFSLLGPFFDCLIFNLIDGALVHGETYEQTPFSLDFDTTNVLDNIEEPFLRALVSLLCILFRDNVWGRHKARDLLHHLRGKLFVGEMIDQNCLKILPRILSVLVRQLHRKCAESELTQEDDTGEFIIDLLERILAFPPIQTWITAEGMDDWFHIIYACYPISMASARKSLVMERDIGDKEKQLLLELFRKQRAADFPPSVNHIPVVSLLLSNLSVIAVGYCWEEFSESDWEFFFSQLRSWIQSAVVKFEDLTERIDDAVSENAEPLDLKSIMTLTDDSFFTVAINALASLKCFFQSSLQEGGDYPHLERLVEGVLRLFFCTGIAESVAKSYSVEAGDAVAASRMGNTLFWELVSGVVLISSAGAREKAVNSVKFWGLSKGPSSALYAILFSSLPFPSLQFTAYSVLSSHPVSQFSIFEEKISEDEQSNPEDPGSLVSVKEELSFMIQKLPDDILDMDLLSHLRVSTFLSWSLFVSHLSYLPSSSPAKEKLVQFVQDSVDPLILDCIFQHLPMESFSTNGARKKDADLPREASAATSSAARAINSGSTLFAVESLWPCGHESLASLAGALYGLMLCVLPSYVRNWFTELRDRSTSIQVELFTRTWCSPPLIVHELQQIKKADYADESFSVSVSKSANEVVATYTKDETGMDLLIRFPASYPVRWLEVDCTRSLGISDVKQRKWLMSMIMFVRNQNGALAEAIRMWKSNFEKEFQGIEECPICYSVIHTSNHSHPRLPCKTCKHKYHSACLYKWFSTSHKSSCPLCQSPF